MLFIHKKHVEDLIYSFWTLYIELETWIDRSAASSLLWHNFSRCFSFLSLSLFFIPFLSMDWKSFPRDHIFIKQWICQAKNYFHLTSIQSTRLVELKSWNTTLSSSRHNVLWLLAMQIKSKHWLESTANIRMVELKFIFTRMSS